MTAVENLHDKVQGGAVGGLSLLGVVVALLSGVPRREVGGGGRVRGGGRRRQAGPKGAGCGRRHRAVGRRRRGWPGGEEEAQRIT
jgi:hypothetical protein